MKAPLALTLTFVLFIALAAPLLAHHSFAAEFEPSSASI
jgi:hypothetical protein